MSGLISCIKTTCRSQVPSNLRRGSAVARLVGLRVRMPAGRAQMSVSRECYM
jgi:hypothetical protein